MISQIIIQKLCNLIMDNGWSDKGKNHQTSKVWAFWAMYVGCPDKIHLCWKKCSIEYQIHIGTWGYEESKSKFLKLVILDQWTQYIAEWDGYEVNLGHWKQMLGCEKFLRAAHAQPHLKKILHAPSHEPLVFDNHHEQF